MKYFFSIALYKKELQIVFLISLLFLMHSFANGSVLFEDNFNDGNADGWNEVVGSWSVNNQIYIAQVEGDPEDLVSTTGDSSWSSYILEADVRPRLGGFNDFGIIFYAQGPDNYLRFTLGSETPPTARISHMVSQESIAELAQVISEPTIVDNQWYHFKLVLQGDNVEAYIDNVLVATASGLPFSQGYIGLASDDVEVDFDNVTVSSLPLTGSGTSGDPYLIQSLADFDEFAGDPNYWDDHIRLEVDIDLTGRTYTTAVIAPDTDNTSNDYIGIGFDGVFDGNGHKIENIVVDTLADAEPGNDDNGYIGLFGVIESSSVIKNIKLENCSINCATSYNVGILAGENMGSIIDCYASGSVTAGDYWLNMGGEGGSIPGSNIGGLCGKNNGMVANSYASCSVTAGAYSTALGGLCGGNSGTIIYCYATGDVSGGNNSWDIGGLVGCSNGNIINSYAMNTVSAGDNTYHLGGLCGSTFGGSINNCYATGAVTGGNQSSSIGGLCGNNLCDITNCYSTGLISGNNSWDIGGLCGWDNGDIGNCFWDTETSGMSDGVGNQNPDPNSVSGKTTTEMQAQSTFTDAGWDFDTPVWMIWGQDYPKLVWNDPDINNSGRVDLADYAVLAQNWLNIDCDMCDKADLTGDRNVNNYDLLILADHWLDEDAISDHVFEIGIAILIDYESPTTTDDTVNGFDLELMTDIMVERVEFLTPGGNVFEITNALSSDTDSETGDGWIHTSREYDEETGMYDWYYEASFTSFAYLDAYGDGNYIITVYYENGRSHQTTAWFGIPGTTDPIAQPTQEPVFTSFDHEDILNSPVTFTWDACTDAAAEFVCFGVENKDTGEEVFETILDVSATGLSEPLDMEAGSYEAKVGFEVWYTEQNSDGIKVEVGKFSQNGSCFTVLGQVGDHVSEIEMSLSYDFGVGYTSSVPVDYQFDAWMRVDDTVVSGTVETPEGVVYPAEMQVDDGENWLGIYVESASLGGLADFTDGVYIFTVTYTNGASQSTPIPFEMEDGSPLTVPPRPVMTAPIHGASDVPLITSFLLDPSNMTNPVWTYGLEYFPTDDGSSALSGEFENLPNTTTTVGPVDLSPNTVYKVELTANHAIWSTNDDGIPFVVDKDSEVEITFTTVPAPGPAITWVSINDPGVAGHETFNGEMSKYETTNAQYCQFLNDALASGDVYVNGWVIYGTDGSNGGADFVNEKYYTLAGSGFTYNGATNGGAARINYSGGVFAVDIGFEDHPVTYVNWYGATAFCNYYGYRLPTDWEWQAVADYDGNYIYGCGTSVNNSIANYENSTHPDGTTVVGSFGSYGYGMCDMAGNVWEWTSSCYYGNCPELRVVRGGSWYDNDDYCTVSIQYQHIMLDTYAYNGFRVCR